MPQGNTRNGSPTGTLLVGVSFFALASYWPELTGARPDAADQLYLGFFQFFGAMGVLGGLTGYYKSWRQREKRKQAENTSDVFGTAAFATLEECVAAGLTDPSGLYLGLLNGQPLFYKLKAHALTVGPARSGKGTDCVFPNLFHCTDSMLVTDPKGELAAGTGRHRAERLGHKVEYFNPWGLHGLPQSRIDPLQNVKKHARDPRLQRGLMDEVKAIALQLLPEPEDQKNRYFRDGSRRIIIAVTIYLVMEEPERSFLPDVWRIVASPRRLERAVEAMMRSPALYGLLADLGDDLDAQMRDNPNQFADFRSGAVQALDNFEPGSPVGEAVSGSDVDLEDVRKNPMTIFEIFPQDKLATHGRFSG